jgi:5'-deoxynucleotidase YfbR-like HD superfamily hydrolase
LNDLVNEYPEKAVHLLLSLSKDAKYDADAPNYLQNTLTDFIINHYATFVEPFKKMQRQDQENISTFVADVESIATYQAFNLILDLFKKNKEIDFVQMFTKAKEERIKSGH